MNKSADARAEPMCSRGIGDSAAVLPGLALAAIGVVFGDIGTSPLYTLRDGVQPAATGSRSTADNVIGDPVGDLLGADDRRHAQVRDADHARRQPRRGRHHGADRARVARRCRQQRRRWWLVGFGIFGAAMFYGDGMITPAISVLCAVEGLEVVGARAQALRRADDGRHPLVGCSRSRSTARRVGALFGPVMCVWFVAIAALGVGRDRARACGAEGAQSRHTPFEFFTGSPAGCVHRARRGRARGHRRRGALRRHGPLRRAPIRRAWFVFVLPGAGAQLLRPGRAADPRRSGGDPESVLPAGARLGAASRWSCSRRSRR